jgi:hypothetical protein
MLTSQVVDKQLDEARRALTAWSEDLSNGIGSVSLPHEVRRLGDLLVCLLDEADYRHHATIHYLIDRCEALSKQVTN